MADLAAALEAAASSLLGPAALVWADWKLYAGPALWAAVWCRYFRGDAPPERMVARFHLTAALVLGADLAVLAMLQAMGSLGVLGLLLLCGANVQLSSRLFGGGAPGPREGFAAESVYEDLEMGFVQVLWIFAGQTLLTAMLIHSACRSYEEGSESLTYSFWAAAYVSVQMSGFFKRSRDSQVGRTWDLRKWRDLVLFRPGAYRRVGGGRVLPVTGLELRARDWMGFLVNTLYRDIIAFVTPVLLMRAEDAMDFVQNSFALSFITLLDDMGEGKDFEALPAAGDDCGQGASGAEPARLGAL